MKKIKWLDRELMTGPCVCLVTSQEECDAAFKDCGVTQRVPWLKNEHSNATAHCFEHCSNGLCFVVAIDVTDRPGLQIAGLLVHEAVHVFQEFCGRIGETNPSAEFEAYAIQSISQRLMQAYAETLE